MNNKLNTWPKYSQNEVEIVSKIISSNKVNYWTGEEGKNFEKEFVAYFGSKYAVAVSNGTVALEIALKALSISCNDEVLVTPRSYISSASSVLNIGAKPVFVDVEENSGNICPNDILKKLQPKLKLSL